MVHRDIGGIIRDIRQAHKGDKSSAPDLSIVNEIKRGMEEAARFQGSDKEKRVVMLCRQLGIDYHKLTPVEFQTMIRILQKSRHMAIPRKRRIKERH